MHGFNNGDTMLNSLCNIANIISLEEHWLACFNMDKLISFLNDFVGYGSAMEDKIQSGVLTGRPFGGHWYARAYNYINAIISVVDQKSSWN